MAAASGAASARTIMMITTMPPTIAALSLRKRRQKSCRGLRPTIDGGMDWSPGSCGPPARTAGSATCATRAPSPNGSCAGTPVRELHRAALAESDDTPVASPAPLRPRRRGGEPGLCEQFHQARNDVDPAQVTQGAL